MHFHHGGVPLLAPRWLGRTVGKGARGSLPSRWRVHHHRVLQPPGSSALRIPGPREPDLLPRSPPSWHSLPQITLVFFGGPSCPSKGTTTFPPQLTSNQVGRGGADCPQCAPGGSRRRARGVAPRSPRSERTGSAAMSATHPTRLETRTKESNTCASQGLARKPPWRNEGEGRPRRRPRWDPEASPSPPRAHHRPVSPAAPGRWSMSARVRTRKMVNYAWAGRSQRKLWWRSVAVLTCKSVVRPGYRGERLIEPSSSWFPPKFPSG